MCLFLRVPFCRGFKGRPKETHHFGGPKEGQTHVSVPQVLAVQKELEAHTVQSVELTEDVSRLGVAIDGTPMGKWRSSQELGFAGRMSELLRHA